MRDDDRPQPPTVVVQIAGPAGAHGETLRQLLAGIEEEGVPSEVVTAAPADARQLAASAARRSSLEIGVGVGRDGSLAATHRTLPDGMTLASSPAPPTGDDARRLGRAAARAAVGLPLDG